MTCAICQRETASTPIACGAGGIRWICGGCSTDRPVVLLDLGAAIVRGEVTV